MTAALRSSTILIDPLDMEAAATALCGRCGDADAEAYRRAVLRELLNRSRGLCSTLTDFSKQAGAHLQGVHCTAGMESDVRSLVGALVAWADAVHEAASSYRDWQDGEVAPEYHDDVPMMSRELLASMGGLSSPGIAAAPPS